MEQFTRASGRKRALDMERVSRSGRTAASMRATGRMTWPMEEADLSILMEMSTKENGLMIRLMVMELIHMLMELLMLVNGLKINNMEKVLKSGLMVPNMKDIT
jgi:hypothetical protein